LPEFPDDSFVLPTCSEALADALMLQHAYQTFFTPLLLGFYNFDDLISSFSFNSALSEMMRLFQGFFGRYWLLD